MSTAVAPFPLEKSYPVVLSDEEGPYQLKEDQVRSLVVLLATPTREEGLLLVSRTHAVDSNVMSYVARIRSTGLKFERRDVTQREIVEAYQRNTDSKKTRGDDETTRQRAFLSLIEEAAKLGASDLKFIVGGEWTIIRYLIAGRGRNVHQLTASEGVLMIRTLYNSMLENQSTSLNLLAEQDGNLRATYAKQVGLAGARVATRPGRDKGLLMTMRLLPADKGSSPTLIDAGYLPQQAKTFLRCTEQKQGVVLLSGATGSGKTSTLKICAEHVDRREQGEIDIITIEDPIEQNLQGHDANGIGGGIAQSPLVKDNDNPDDAARAWPRNIANLMRHAPKIIIPGEIRDKASAIAAFDFAMSGHGVWTTFHAFQAEGILMRLDEWGVSRDMLLNPSLVIALANQCLVRRLCDACKQPLSTIWNSLTAEQQHRFKTFTPVDGVYVATNDPNCPTCKGRGGGRTIAAEVVEPDEAYMETFRNKGGLAARRHWVFEMGGITKTAHVLQHVAAGRVDPRHAEGDVSLLDFDHKYGLHRAQAAA